MVPANQIIKLSPRAFWDIDMTKMDYEGNADYIIRKVFEYGTVEDIGEVLAYYGHERVKVALMTAPYLMEKTLRLASTLFDIPVQVFKCFTARQRHPLS